MAFDTQTIDHAPGEPAVAAPARERVRLMLFISSLERGGAERQVVELMRQIDRTRFEPLVCTLSDVTPLAEFLPDPANDLLVLPKRWKFDATTVTRLAREIRRRRIDVLHAFLFDAELTARLARLLARTPVVVASERNADYRRPWLHWLGQKLTSGLFDHMIANSNAGKRFNMRTLGLPDERISVIHNGVDVERFIPSDKLEARHALGLPESGMVVGMIAAFKTQKNHGDFFRMARQVLNRQPHTWFLCVGEPLRDNQQGADDYHRQMRELVYRLGIADRCIFAGARDDMPDVYNACDLTVLSSQREGTPNVLLESMACGVPIVATDVADNAAVAPHEQCGFIVPLGDVEELSRRVVSLLSDHERRAALGAAARAWVTHEFSTAALARKTEQVYLRLLEEKRKK